MSANYLHHHPNFNDLIRIVGQEKSIQPALIEKDYWIMHCLYGLQQIELQFELKGGTSLSKGWKIINRFSEDIDIHIEPPENPKVWTGKNNDKPVHSQSRKDFYDWLAKTIKIDGIENIERDTGFDDVTYRSGGIRLKYKTTDKTLPDLKEGILLEVGFDNIAPTQKLDISSWAYDYAYEKVDIIDNRAQGIACYHPGYTLVEKLQTVSTKYRTQQTNGKLPANFIRHYYDIYCLLELKEVLEFISSSDYTTHKQKRFRKADNPIISENEAFLLTDRTTRDLYRSEYRKKKSLYYADQPEFDEILFRIREFSDRL